MDIGSRQMHRARTQFEKAEARAEKSLGAGHVLSAVVWVQIAADIAFHRHPGFYISSYSESVLLEAARRLGKSHVRLPAAWAFRPKNNGTRKHILHVMTKAYATGGHTRVVESWVRNSRDDAVHSVVTTSQVTPVSQSLISAVEEAKGRYISIVGLPDLLRRAALLRQIARDWADLVVLHSHPFDVVPIVAFGSDGGPPVLVFNHADHVFWLGATVADLVANFRPLGQKLTQRRRGILNSGILPVPLMDPHSSPPKEIARKSIGIPVDTTVLLTIGRDDKYLPFSGYDFVTTAMRILIENTKSILLAVGPRSNERWRQASARVGGRIVTLGTRTDLDWLYACADIYLPSFPVGGLIALLDAGLRGIPVVGLSNRESPLLCGADDPSLEKLGNHVSSVKEYEGLVSRMISDSNLRQEMGLQVKDSVRAAHTQPGWYDWLREIIPSLPPSHDVRVPWVSDFNPDESDLFLAGYDALSWPHYALATVLAKHSRCFYRQDLLKVIWEIMRNIDTVPTIPPRLALSSLVRLLKAQ